MKKNILILAGIIFVIWGGMNILKNNFSDIRLDDLVAYYIILFLGIISLGIGFFMNRK